MPRFNAARLDGLAGLSDVINLVHGLGGRMRATLVDDGWLSLHIDAENRSDEDIIIQTFEQPIIIEPGEQVGMDFDVTWGTLETRLGGSCTQPIPPKPPRSLWKWLCDLFRS